MDKRKLIKELTHFVKNVNKDYKIKEVYLFGSRARGRPKKDSDADLIIISGDFRGMSFFQRGAAMYNYWNLPLSVDFLCYTPEEFESLRKRVSIVREAIASGILISSY